MLNTYIRAEMKTMNVFSITGTILRKLGLAKIYYWFNK